MTLRSRSLGGTLVSLSILATPFACVVPKQLGEDAGSSDDSASADDGNTTADVPLEGAVAAMATARCEAYFACECGVLFPDIIWTTQAECESAMQQVFATTFDESEAARRTYDPACVSEYIDFYDAADCHPTGPADALAWDEIMHCPFFHGDLPAGAACNGDPLLVPGATDCGEDLGCAVSSCQPRKADGEACEPSGLFSQRECQHGSYCDAASSQCTPLPVAGEACTADSLCSPEAYCIDDICSPTAAPGEPCQFALQCSYGLCDPETSTCLAVPAACSPWGVEIQDSCESARLATADFVEENSQCDSADDCVALDAFCYGFATCGSISVNVDHDPEQWAEISAALDTCDDCGADPCGFGVACIDGRCGFEP